MRQFCWCVFACFALTAQAAEERKLKVLTSFLPVYSFTANLAGDLARVENMLPPGATPHDFQLSPADRRKFDEADLVIINGLGVESWLDKLLKDSRKQVVKLSAGLPRRTNPHIWLDPILAAHAITNILSGLQAADPAHVSEYAANAQAYIRKLAALDADFRSGLAPARGAAIVTYHDAFEHLARRYGLRVVGVVEETAEVSPGPRHLAKLRRTIRAEAVRTIFTDAEHPQKLAEQLGKDCGVAVVPLHTLENGELTRTAYEDGMRKNLSILKKTLTAHASANAR